MGIRLFGAVQGIKAQVQGLLLGLGTGGDAKASEVLSGKVVTTDVGEITGTMPNVGSVTLTPGPSNVPIPQGYHDGTGKVPAVVVPAANVLTGTTIAGTPGIMPNKGAVTITPGPSGQAIPAGYHNGSGTVPGVSVPAGNVLLGTTIAGTAGTMTDMGATDVTNVTTAIWGDGSLAVYLGTTGYYRQGSAPNGGSEIKVSPSLLQSAEGSLTPSNILSGVSIFGIVGSAINGAGMKHFASGSGTLSSTTLSVSGLNFTPTTIIVGVETSGSMAQRVYNSSLPAPYFDYLSSIETVFYPGSSSLGNSYNLSVGWTVNYGSFSVGFNFTNVPYAWVAYE